MPHEVSLCADFPAQAAAVTNGKRLALIITINLEYWGRHQGHGQAYLAGRTERCSRTCCRATLRQPELDVAGVRPARRHLADVRHLRQVSASPSGCTMNAQDGVERRGGDQAASIVAGRSSPTTTCRATCSPTTLRPAKERDDHPRDAAGLQRGLGKPAKGWLSSSLRGTLNTVGHPRRGRPDLPDRPDERRPALSGPDRLRTADRLDPRTPGDQRFHRVHAPGTGCEGAFSVFMEQFDGLPRGRDQRPADESRSASAPVIGHPFRISRAQRVHRLREVVRTSGSRRARRIAGVVSGEPPHPHRLKDHDYLRGNAYGAPRGSA